MSNLSQDQKYELAVKKQQAIKARQITASNYNSVNNTDTQLMLNKQHREYKKLMGEIRLLEHVQQSKNIAIQIENTV